MITYYLEYAFIFAVLSPIWYLIYKVLRTYVFNYKLEIIDKKLKSERINFLKCYFVLLISASLGYFSFTGGMLIHDYLSDIFVVNANRTLIAYFFFLMAISVIFFITPFEVDNNKFGSLKIEVNRFNYFVFAFKPFGMNTLNGSIHLRDSYQPLNKNVVKDIGKILTFFDSTQCSLNSLTVKNFLFDNRSQYRIIHRLEQKNCYYLSVHSKLITSGSKIPNIKEVTLNTPVSFSASDYYMQRGLNLIAFAASLASFKDLKEKCNAYRSVRFRNYLSIRITKNNQ